jgi:ABC-type phosphate transport system substrate-binding protein
MRKAIYFLLLCVPWALAPSTPAQSDGGFVVIVNDANPKQSMDRDLVRKLFLKQLKSWESGVAAAPVDQDAKSEVREVFTREVHGKKVSAIKSYWQRMIFSGRAVPPPELDSDESVLTYVRSDPGGIGYVAPGTELGDGVRELELTVE